MSTERRSTRLVAPLAGVAAFLLVWEAVVRVGEVRPFVLRAPSRIFGYVLDHPADFAAAAWVTAQHALLGSAAALVVALGLGALLAASRLLEHAAAPVLTLLQVTPFVAYIASVVLWLGPGTRPAVFLVGVVCLPGFTFAAVDGMRSADPAARELLRSVNAGRLEVLWRLRLPSALPSLFTSARYHVGLALIAAYLVEGGNFADEGLGAIGRRAVALNEGDALWAAIVVMALLGMLGLLAISAARRSTLHWHASQRT